MNRKFLETCMAIALFSLVGYAVWAQSGTTTSPTPTGISTQSPMQDDIQARLKALRARLELIRQRVRKCGNSIVESREQCDDGNRVSGDGCSRTCTVEVIADPEPVAVETSSTQQTTTCPPESETRPYSTCLPSKLITLDLKVFLQGAYNATQGLMNDALRVQGRIPLQQPYQLINNSIAQTHIISSDAGDSILTVAGASAVVDWVVVEIRSLEDLGSASTLIASIPALVLRDGRVVNAHGSPIVIPSRSTNYEYHIAIRHRNHLGVMSTNAYAFGGLTADTTITVNFTTPGVAYGTNPQKVLNGVALMRAGDANGNNQVSYQGANSDADAVLATVGVSTPNAIVEGYLPTDLNLDGKTKYNGSLNDRNVILGTVGLATPTNVVQGQIP